MGMEQLVTSRRSCRRFLDKNVDPEIITRILSAMGAAPTGGNAQGVEYTVIDDKDCVHEIWQAAYSVIVLHTNIGRMRDRQDGGEAAAIH